MIKFTLGIEVGDPDELGRWLARVLVAVEQGARDGKAKQGTAAPAGPPPVQGPIEPKVEASTRSARGSENGVGDSGLRAAGGRDPVGGVRREVVSDGGPGGSGKGAGRVSGGLPDYSKVGNFRKLITAVQADGAKTVDEIFAVLQEVHAAGTCPVLRVIDPGDLEDRVRSACELMGI